MIIKTNVGFLSSSPSRLGRGGADEDVSERLIKTDTAKAGCTLTSTQGSTELLHLLFGCFQQALLQLQRGKWNQKHFIVQTKDHVKPSHDSR